MIKISIPWITGSNQAQSFKKGFLSSEGQSMEVANLQKLGQKIDRVYIASLATANT